MFKHNVLYDAILYIYALSLLFTFSDFVLRNPRAKRLGTGLLAFVWVLQSVYMLSEAAKMDTAALYYVLGSPLFLSWLIVTISLVLIWIIRVDVLFLVNAAGFAAASMTFVTNRTLTGAQVNWNVRDDLLLVHVTMANAAYAAFVFSALFSILMLFLQGRLKMKRWSSRLGRLPSLDELHKWALRFVLAGTPLLLLSLILGLAWVAAGREWRLMTDWKVLNSLLIIAVYGFYMWQRYKAAWSWSRLSLLNLAGVAMVLSNYLWVSRFSYFHG